MTREAISAVHRLMASQAQSAAFLFFSAAIVEGIGAALMLPATASLLVSTYRGKDRALAFGVYGAIAGAAATIGEQLGSAPAREVVVEAIALGFAEGLGVRFERGELTPDERAEAARRCAAEADAPAGSA